MNRAFLHVNWHVNNDRSVITAGVLLIYCCFLLINKIHLLQFSCRLRTKRHMNYCPQRKVQFFLERENFQRLQPSKQTRLSAIALLPKKNIYPIFKRVEFVNLFVEKARFKNLVNEISLFFYFVNLFIHPATLSDLANQ